MNKEKAEHALGLVTRLLTKYKYAVLVLFAGVVLLTLSAGGAPPDAAPSEEPAPAALPGTFDLAAFEGRLEESLSQISGAGRVQLTLSLKATEESVYAADIRQAQQSADSSSYESALAMVSGSTGGEQPILVKNLYPTFRGALVLCDGAEDDAVRLAVTQAVSTVCGLGTDKVSVLKMQRFT